MGMSGLTGGVHGIAPVVTHQSMPAQPSRQSSLATAAPIKKPTPPIQSHTTNPSTPSVSVPTPPPSVTPTDTSIPSPGIMRTSQSQGNVPFPGVNTVTGGNDTSTINQQQQQQQQSDLMQSYNSLGKKKGFND